MFLSLSPLHTHTHANTHTQTRTRTLTHAHTHTLSHTHVHTHTLSLSLTDGQTDALSLTIFVLSPILSPPLPPSHTRSLYFGPPLLSLSLSPSHPQSLSVSVSLTHTHTHTLSLCLSHSHTHTHTLPHTIFALSPIPSPPLPLKYTFSLFSPTAPPSLRLCLLSPFLYLTTLALLPFFAFLVSMLVSPQILATSLTPDSDKEGLQLDCVQHLHQSDI